jgi:hypothetical protein
MDNNDKSSGDKGSPLLVSDTPGKPKAVPAKTTTTTPHSSNKTNDGNVLNSVTVSLFTPSTNNDVDDNSIG